MYKVLNPYGTGGSYNKYIMDIMSIQESSKCSSNALIYQDGLLISGSLEALIQHLVPTSTYYPDRAYIFAFLLSSRLFIKPHVLMREVCEICSTQQNLTNGLIRDGLGKFGINMVALLTDWTETFPYDFRDERVMMRLKDIIQRLSLVDPSLHQTLMLVLNNIIDRLTELDRYEEKLALNSEAAQRLVDTETVTDINDVCESPAILAEQLTHIELERLRNIGPEEFVQAFARESNKKELAVLDMKKTKNLEHYERWFNRLSYLVATEICINTKKKHRARTVEYFIEVAKECFNIGNFNSLMAIISGLSMAPVARLKKTWAKVDKSKFDVLEVAMAPASNFHSYRSTLQAAVWRSKSGTDDRQKIIVPLFSLLLKDIFYLNEGCANRLPDGHINFEKFWQLAKQIGEVMAWKRVQCPFEKDDKVLAYLLTNPVFSEHALALASYDCEPAESSFEKDRQKSLKTSTR